MQTLETFAPPAVCYPGTLRLAAHQNSGFARAERIRTRYFWSASLHKQEVAMLVENGRATLPGTVATWPDRQHAARAARARMVDNALFLSTASGL
jgi:hypothetical protein